MEQIVADLLLSKEQKQNAIQERLDSLHDCIKRNDVEQLRLLIQDNYFMTKLDPRQFGYVKMYELPHVDLKEGISSYHDGNPYDQYNDSICCGSIAQAAFVMALLKTKMTYPEKDSSKKDEDSSKKDEDEDEDELFGEIVAADISQIGVEEDGGDVCMQVLAPLIGPIEQLLFSKAVVKAAFRVDPNHTVDHFKVWVKWTRPYASQWATVFYSDWFCDFLGRCAGPCRIADLLAVMPNYFETCSPSCARLITRSALNEGHCPLLHYLKPFFMSKIVLDAGDYDDMMYQSLDWDKDVDEVRYTVLDWKWDPPISVLDQQYIQHDCYSRDEMLIRSASWGYLDMVQMVCELNAKTIKEDEKSYKIISIRSAKEAVRYAKQNQHDAIVEYLLGQFEFDPSFVVKMRRPRR